MGLAKARRSSSYVAGEIAAFCSYLDFLKKTYNLRPVHPEDLMDLRPRVEARRSYTAQASRYVFLQGKSEIKKVSLKMRHK